MVTFQFPEQQQPGEGPVSATPNSEHTRAKNFQRLTISPGTYPNFPHPRVQANVPREP